VACAKSAEQVALLEYRRRWRLLRVQPHPDAGGDHELFAFACAVKKEVCDGECLEREPHREWRAGQFLRGSKMQQTIGRRATGTP